MAETPPASTSSSPPAVMGGQLRWLTAALGGALLVLSLPAEHFTNLQSLLAELDLAPLMQRGLAVALIGGTAFFSWRQKLLPKG